MMYAKLVLRNARRSARDYLIYILTMTICVMLFYSFLSISSNYYHPDIGTSYDFTLLSDGMKAAICIVTLLLLFLIRYVNSYMLRCRQKEFAIQSVMGMEQKTVGWIFFAETVVMGTISIIIGIALGAFCSQFITAMLLTSYGKSYSLTWMLFPDTILLTVCFFSVILFAVGLFHVRTIKKIKIIDMLSADKRNDPELKESQFIPAIAGGYFLFSIWMVETGIQKMYFFFDPRFALPVHILFWSNLLVPALTCLWSILWFFKKKAWTVHVLLIGLLLCATANTAAAACVPIFQNHYYLALGAGTVNQYLVFVIVDLLFIIYGIIYLASSMIIAWKNKSPAHKYHGQNLFFFGQFTSKLATTTKTMTLICITLTAAIFIFIAAPVLTEWSSGYLDVRSMYDVQIYSRYNNVYHEEELPKGDYHLVTDFLTEHAIQTNTDCIFNLYLPKHESFHNRMKYDFPVAAISLTDYNRIREMLGYDGIALRENEFTTQWRTIATKEEREEFIHAHREVSTDVGNLTLSGQPIHEEPMGESLYNSYTDVLYVFPDKVCQKLLPVMKNRYIRTAEEISYENARSLEKLFTEMYPEENDNGAEYGIRLSTLQINSTKASNFILKAAMFYGAVILMVMCLTILALQQLLDVGQYRYRFSLLRKLGVDERDIRRLAVKQLGVWFGLPVIVAMMVSAVVVTYFMQSVSAEISAYIGFGALLIQVAVTILILILLLVCYFISTWTLFKKSIEE